jgi:hypothetical protein
VSFMRIVWHFPGPSPKLGKSHVRSVGFVVCGEKWRGVKVYKEVSVYMAQRKARHRVKLEAKAMCDPSASWSVEKSGGV